MPLDTQASIAIEQSAVDGHELGTNLDRSLNANLGSLRYGSHDAEAVSLRACVQAAGPGGG